ncbi:MAG: aminotransferase class I/II-fold pyridoxal phosphate-dependent enzyme [Candidatus Heimdallarchaeota archaeon]|nr:MAG: aminotransferase class I/II-fold pyridoxal phosphate-dependent enzyme [Candidatus Heimdallarchaeota archaeon]
MQESMKFLSTEMKEITDAGREWVHRVLEGPSDTICNVEGNEVIMLCSNNYLGLSNHPKMKEAAINAVKTHGVGSGSVRAIAGNMDLHEQWEKRLAEFKEQEAAFITSAGFTANQGVIQQLAPTPDDVILSDRLNHGSIIDGVRTTKAKRAVYEHCDTGSLEDELSKLSKENPRRILVITDGVFSMDGDHAPLDEIYKVCEPYSNAIIYVDDAHGDGVLGRNYSGKGLVDHYGLQGKVHIEMGTFSKAFGTMGGSIVGSKELVTWCRNKTRSYLLSASHPPATAAASIKALDLIEHEEPGIVKKLWENIEYFKKQIIDMGYNHEITSASTTAIIPIIFGDPLKAKKASNSLYSDYGIFALPIVFPMVPRGLDRIRVQANAALSKDQLDQGLRAFEEVGKKLGIF